MPDCSFSEKARVARDWLIEQALPFWATTGIDGRCGGFHEGCDLGGNPIQAAPRRLMVQARQIYVFSHAQVLGWHPRARDIAACGVEHLMKGYHRVDGRPGFVFSLTPAGDVADGRRNTYGHAFVLLALAWYFRATGDSQVAAIARATADFIDAELSDGSGGFVDDMPRGDPLKRQNPHMHLLEGYLALYEATQDRRYLDSAAGIAGLFQSCFFNRDTETLREYFADDWRPADADEGRIWEPGHHFEWAWLLQNYARATGLPPIPEARMLYDRARALGLVADGRIVDEMLDDGTVFKSSTRVWPLTEAIKAGVTLADRGDSSAGYFVADSLAVLMSRFTGRPWPAGWMDRLDLQGNPIATHVPASTLYHLFLAIAEANGRINRSPTRALSDDPDFAAPKSSN